MRVSLFLVFIFLTISLLSWAILDGAILFLSLFVSFVLLVITIVYPDKMLLILLGARAVHLSGEKEFFEAASQEAYKLSVPIPDLYFYNGTLERAFIFQGSRGSSIVINKRLLERASRDELNAICFGFLLQVKKNMASKRTRVMFILGFLTWLAHTLTSIFIKIFPAEDVKKSINWFVNYLINPMNDLIFRLIIGKQYFNKLQNLLNEYVLEKELLERLGLKLRQPNLSYFVPSKKMFEFQAINKSKHFQNIISIEYLPHEWDYFFHHLELASVGQV